jgi:hypothetical protein
MKSAAGLVLAIDILIAGVVSNLAATGPSAQQARGEEKSKETAYDGNWWLTKEVDERQAFIDGSGDCLIWVAHVKGLGTGYEMEEKITRFYKTHPAAKRMPVVDVGRKVVKESPPPKPSRGGEVWTNPHGYLNGTYWSQLYYDATRQAFLEGYLSCLRTCVSKPTQTYSRPAAYYVPKISKYIAAHPRTAYDEAIADILSRLRDNPKQPEAPSDRPSQ